MVITKKESYLLNEIFMSQRLSKMQSLGLIAELKRLETENGIAFVVKRLKSVKAALLSGDSSGFKKNRKGCVSGPFGVLFTKSSISRKDAIRMDRVARVYGRWVSKPPTVYQWIDYANSVEGKLPKGTILPRVTISARDLKKGQAISSSATFQEHIPLSNVKKAPFVGKVSKDLTPESHFHTLLDNCPNVVYRHSNVFKHIWDADYSLSMVLISKGRKSYWDHHTEVVGKICALTADRGLKLRYVANPLLGIQIATSRLQRACDAFLKSMPESCVHDQLSIVQWAVPKLERGEIAWSIDLTSATDRFPLAIQLQVLNDLFPDLADDIKLFEDVSRLDWETPVGPVHFGTGQPMGLAPSFAAFSVTHTLLIKSLGGNSDNFRVCGDDVVIFDYNLAIAYIDLITLIGVEISYSKSLMGDTKVEFAGRIIDKFGPWRSYKAAKVNLAQDPLGFVRQYGLCGLKLLPKDVRPLVKFFSTVPCIGFSGLEDFSTLDLIDSDLVEQLYCLRQGEIYPVLQANRETSRFNTCNFSLYEGFPLRKSLIGTGVSNNPVLVEHVLSNTPRTILENRTAFVDMLAKDLKVGFQPDFNEDSAGSLCEKIPLSRLKGLFKNIKTVLNSEN